MINRTYKNVTVNRRVNHPIWQAAFQNYICDGWGAYNNFTSVDVLDDNSPESQALFGTLSRKSKSEVISAALHVMCEDQVLFGRGEFIWLIR